MAPSIIGHEIGNNNPIPIDVQRVIEGRLLLQANSGGGKSYAIRKFCESTYGAAQQILIDVEGEFASLREKFDYILVGENGDIPININAAELLAKRILELNTSAIIDLYELKHQQRKHFVKLFLDSSINAPKNLWHPALFIIDECHIFAPEKGEAESLNSVIDLATRGRKRGFALVAATQRISKFNKDVVAELNTKLIGRSSLDVDMKRAAFELGFTDKKDILSLRNLKKGEFYAFGPALIDTVTKIKIDKVKTTHHEAGASFDKLETAPPEKVRRILEKLSDLPQAAEKEIKTKEDMQRKIIELKRENAVLKRQQPKGIDKKEAEKLGSIAYKQGYEKCKNEHFPLFLKYEEFNKKLAKGLQDIQQIAGKLNIELPRNEKWPKYKDLKTPIKVSIPQAAINNAATKEATASVNLDHGKLETVTEPPQGLRAGAMKMLKVCAQYYPETCTKIQLGTMAGYSIKGGTFTTYLSELKRAGWIEISGEDIKITEEGLKHAGNVEPLPTDHESLLQLWSSKFRAGAVKMLKTICSHYPSTITVEELADETGFSASGGTFSTYLSELRRNKLIVIENGGIKASEALFP